MKVLFVISVLLLASALGYPDYAPGRECYKNQDPECFCPLIFDPVCGVNGCTYGNSCQLVCADVEMAYEGECKRN